METPAPQLLSSSATESLQAEGIFHNVWKHSTHPVRKVGQLTAVNQCGHLQKRTHLNVVSSSTIKSVLNSGYAPWGKTHCCCVALVPFCPAFRATPRSLKVPRSRSVTCFNVGQRHWVWTTARRCERDAEEEESCNMTPLPDWLRR